MKVKIEWSSLSDAWSVAVGAEHGNSWCEVFKSEDYGKCVVIATAYVQVGHRMVEPKKG